ncbi:MAG: DUF1203 domain-containing protein [Alphaproteobacteria bacterium]
MRFQVHPLPASRFAKLFGQSDAALLAAGVEPAVADSKPGFPCRVSLRDAEPGERVLLLNYEHQSAATPFRASHAIYVIDGAEDAHPNIGEVPDLMRTRLLSVRAFSEDGHILDADVATGDAIAPLFNQLLANPAVSYLHAHYAKLGCYAARVDRA